MRIIVVIFSIFYLSVINIAFINANSEESEAVAQLKGKGVDVRLLRGKSGMYIIGFDNKTTIKDDDLKFLLPIKNKVKNISIYDGRKSHKILEYIKEMSNVEVLGIKMNISDRELINFQDLKKLKSLIIVSNSINGEGLVYLKELKNISNLDLEIPLKEEKLSYLEGYEKLRILNLNNTPITDKALTIISSFKSKELIAVYLIGTKVTKQAAQSFYKLRGVEACINANECNAQ